MGMAEKAIICISRFFSGASVANVKRRRAFKKK